MKTLLLLLFSSFALCATAQTDYTWTGSSGTSWANAGNWTPSGIPGSGDRVLIGTTTNAPVLDGNRTVLRIKQTANTLDLNSYTLTVTGTALLLGGTVTDGRLLQTGGSTDTTQFYYVNMDCKVNVESVVLRLNNSTFADSTRLSLKGTLATSHGGNNDFDGPLEVRNRDAAYIGLGWGGRDSINSSLILIDSSSYGVSIWAHFGGTVKLSQRHTGTIVLNGGNFAQDVTLNAKSGSGGIRLYGPHTLASGRTIRIDSGGYLASQLSLHKITQLGTEPIVLTNLGTTSDVGIWLCDLGGTLTSSSGYLIRLEQTLFRAEVDVSAKMTLCNRNRFYEDVTLTRDGGVNLGQGGSRFYKDVTITHATGSNAAYYGNYHPDTVMGDLTMNNYATGYIIWSYAQTSRLHGNVTLNAVNGPIYMGSTTNGRVNMCGTGDQVWTATTSLSNGITHQDFRIDKPSGDVLLNGNADIINSLQLVKGNIVPQSGNYVRLRDNATVTGASDSSHVVGPVRKVGNDAFTYPIGRGGTYKPLYITAPSATTAEFNAEYFTGNSHLVHTHSLRDGTLNHISTNEYWTLTRQTGTSTPSVKLAWDTIHSCRMGLPLTGVHVTGWDPAGAGQWKDLGNGGTTGTVDAGTVQTAAAVTVFNTFTLAHDSIMDCCSVPPAIAQSGSLSPCEGDSSGIALLSGSGAFADYMWTSQGDTMGTGPTLEVEDFRTYALSRQACPDTATYVADTPDGLHLVVTPQLTPDGFNLTCYHASDGIVQVALGGGTPPYDMDYTYNGQPFVPIFAQLGAGTYTLTVTDQDGCTVSDTATLTAPEQPLALGFAGTDRTITEGESVQIGGSSNVNYTYLWYPSTGLSDSTAANPVAYPSDTTMYILTVATQDTCVSKDTVMVNVLPWEPVALDSADIVFVDSVPSHVRGELIVKFKADRLKMDRVDNVNIQRGSLSLFLPDSVIGRMRLASYGHYNDDPTVMNGWGIRKIFRKMTSADSISISRLGDTVKMTDFWTTFTITLAEELDEIDMLDSLASLSMHIQSMDLNLLAQLHDAPDDPYFELQHSLNTNGDFPNAHINMEAAWDLEVGSPDRVKVGVFDTGITWSTADFGDGTFEGSKIVGGWDYWLNHHISETTIDNHGHGTKCAGIIGALRNNGIGIAGIAGGDIDNASNTGAQLFAFKIFYDDEGSFANEGGFATVETAASALVEGSSFNPNTGYGYGLNVLSNSWGIPPVANPFTNSPASLYHSSLRTVVRNHATAVFSRGNEESDNEVIPTTQVPDEFLISVGASDQNGLRASFSSFGTKMDLLAPGTPNIVLATSNNPLSTPVEFDGTSAAAPHVAGVAALMISHHHPNHPDFAYPNGLAPEDVEQVLEQYALDIDDEPTYSVGYDNRSGWGKLDAGAALQAVHGPEHTVHHYDMAGVTPSDVTTTDVTVSLTSDINNVAAGLYYADKHVITWADWVPLSDNETIVPLDVWPRFSSSVGFSQSSPIIDIDFYNLEWNENEIGGMNGVEVTATTTCWFIDRTYPLNQPVQQWIPAHPSQLKAAYSIHQHDLNTTGVDEVSSNDGALLYPNPTQGEMTLLLSNSEALKSVEVTDAIGRQMAVPTVIAGGTVTLNVSSLSVGMYLLRVTMGANRQVIRRFVVQ